MDRPEDIEVNPLTGKVYVALTNNTRRQAGQESAPNPRAPNPMGHIVEITESGNDNGATRFRWEIFMLCGDPSDPSHASYFSGFDASRVSRIANPDNLAFDDRRIAEPRWPVWWRSSDRLAGTCPRFVAGSAWG